jgi:hypothetical protein
MDAETKAMRDKTREANMNACRRETMACQETTEAHLECKEPTSEGMEPETVHQEKMDVWIADMKDGGK